MTIALTWPQVWHPLSIPDNIDTYYSLWRVAWIPHQLIANPSHFFDGNIFYPNLHTLAYSDAIPLEGVLAAPLIWLGVPTPLVYNLLVFVSFPLSAMAVYWLVCDLTQHRGAAIIGGLIFAFTPYRFDHYMHLELLWGMWMPFALWMLHRTIRTGRVRDGLLTGLFVALQGLSSIYYVVFFAIVLLVMTPILLLRSRVAEMRRAAVALGCGAILSGALTDAAILLNVPSTFARRLVSAALAKRCCTAPDRSTISPRCPTACFTATRSAPSAETKSDCSPVSLRFSS